MIFVSPQFKINIPVQTASKFRGTRGFDIKLESRNSHWEKKNQISIYYLHEQCSRFGVFKTSMNCFIER